MIQDTDQTGGRAVAELRQLVLAMPTPAAAGEENQAAAGDVPSR